jgi:hypothetical protein
MRGSVKKNKNFKNIKREDIVTYTRLRTGHTRLTHGHFNEEKPKCDCGKIQTTEHIFNCKNGEEKRRELEIFIGDQRENVKKVNEYIEHRGLKHEI